MKRVVILSLLLLALMACGGSAESEPAALPTPTATPQPTQTSVIAEAPVGVEGDSAESPSTSAAHPYDAWVAEQKSMTQFEGAIGSFAGTKHGYDFIGPKGNIIGGSIVPSDGYAITFRDVENNELVEVVEPDENGKFMLTLPHDGYFRISINNIAANDSGYVLNLSVDSRISTLLSPNLTGSTLLHGEETIKYFVEAQPAAQIQQQFTPLDSTLDIALAVKQLIMTDETSTVDVNGSGEAETFLYAAAEDAELGYYEIELGSVGAMGGEVGISAETQRRYTHSGDCLAYNERLTLPTFALMYSAEFEKRSCTYNALSYITFVKGSDYSDSSTMLTVRVANFDIVATDSRDHYARYLNNIDDAASQATQLFVDNLEGEIVAEAFLDINGLKHFQADIVGTRKSIKTLQRLMIVPNPITGQGLFFVGTIAVENDVETGQTTLDVVMLPMVESVQFGAVTPEDAVKVIFDAAVSAEFSSIATICHPEFDYDGSAALICSLNTDPSKREEFAAYFENAQITDKTIYEADDYAGVPVLIGYADEPLEETIYFFLYDGNWYLADY